MTDSQTSMQMKTIHQTLQLPVLKILYKQSPTHPVRVMYAYGMQFHDEAFITQI